MVLRKPPTRQNRFGIMHTMKPKIESPRCGGWIEPQFGRTRRCSTDDDQCTHCRLRESEMRLELLLDAVQEAIDHEGDFYERTEEPEPSWLGNLRAATDAVQA